MLPLVTATLDLGLIGDYDASRLWQASNTEDAHGNPLPGATYTDISALVRTEFNDAVRRDGGDEAEEYEL